MEIVKPTICTRCFAPTRRTVLTPDGKRVYACPRCRSSVNHGAKKRTRRVKSREPVEWPR